MREDLIKLMLNSLYGKFADKNSTESKIVRAKLMLNSLYGKFVDK